MKNYYTILELSEKCTIEDIKKNYRRLAKMYHPDTNLGKVEYLEKFKIINEAYEVLSNDEKRKNYDHSMGFNNIFNRFEKDFNDIFKNKKTILHFKIFLSLEQIHYGCSQIVNDEKEKYEIKIPQGTLDKELLKYTLSNGKEAHVEVAVRKHEYLIKEEDDDIFVQLPLTYGEILNGVEVEILILNQKISLKISPKTNYGKILFLKHKGLYNRHSNSRGMLLIEIIPQTVELNSKEIKEILKMEKQKKIENPSFVYSKKTTL